MRETKPARHTCCLWLYAVMPADNGTSIHIVTSAASPLPACTQDPLSLLQQAACWSKIHGGAFNHIATIRYGYLLQLPPLQWNPLWLSTLSSQSVHGQLIFRFIAKSRILLVMLSSLDSTHNRACCDQRQPLVMS